MEENKHFCETETKKGHGAISRPTAQSILHTVKRDILDVRKIDVKKRTRCQSRQQQWGNINISRGPLLVDSDSDSSITNPFQDSNESSDESYVPDSMGDSDFESDDETVGNLNLITPLCIDNEASQQIPDQTTSRPTQQDINTNDISGPSARHSHNESPSVSSKAGVSRETTSSTSSAMKQSGHMTTKPSRPCVFCGIFQSQLKRHMVRKHSNEESVQAALKQPKAVQFRAFEALRKEGIYQKNLEIMNSDDNTALIRERKQGDQNLVMCTGCKGFFSKKRICKHKKYFCSHGASPLAESLTFSKATHTVPCSEEFQYEILNRFREDEAGQLCRKDKVILLLGQKAWAKSAKKERRVIMTEMRLLANLILQMRVVALQPMLQGEDVVDRNNFDTLTDAIQNLSKNDCSKGEKSALKLMLGYMLKKIIKVLKGYYIQQNDMDRASEVERFQSVLDLNWDFIFYTAQLACEQRRNTLRKPSDMPLEEDVHSLRNFIMSEIQVILEDEYRIWDYHEFVWMRNLIVSRLTLYNARRGGEPARLTLLEWKEAEESQWVDPELAEKVTDPLEEALLGGTKLAYMAGKGSKKLVPVLIPNDTVEAVSKLVAERKNVGIVDDNVFLFPNTSNSRDHVSGYSCIKAVASALGDKLKKPKLLIADKFRHRASTLFALLDLPEEERESWYRHMGHSATMNRDVYQSPLAITEMTRVGKFLKNLDFHGKDAISHGNTAQNKKTPGVQAVISSPTRTASQDTFMSTPSIMSPSQNNIEQNNESEMHAGASTSRTESVINVSMRRPKKRQYTQWNEEDRTKVASYFDKFIKAKGTGSKGSLPGVKEVEIFLSQFEIFQGQNISKKQKISLIKIKVFNERNKHRHFTKDVFESC